jgi:outer membrane immunogenic protein
MKNLLLTSVAMLSGVAGTAMAADIPVKMPVKAVTAAAPFSWTGCYAGVQGGYGWGKTRNTEDDVTSKNRGWLAGGQLGCDYQFAPNWVVGIEGMAAWTDIHSVNDPFFSGKLFGGNFSTRMNWIASATARFGFGMDRWLVYVKGGGAWADQDYRRAGSSIGGPFDYRASRTGSGWTAGVGSEVIFAPNWSARLEFNHYDFGRDSERLNNVLSPGVFVIRHLRSTVQTVTVGVNYRFATGAVPPP